MKENLKKYLIRKNRRKVFFIFSYIFLIYIFTKLLNIKISIIISGIVPMFELFSEFFSPQLSYAGEIFPVLADTVFMAFIASISGLLFSVPFALAASYNLSFSKKISKILSAVFAVLRTVPSLVWAAILVSIFSVGRFSGIFSLFIISFLMSVKLIKEYLESISENKLMMMRSLGAGRMKMLISCVLPELSPLIISSFFLIFETCIRSAAVLGMVGAGGIGERLWVELSHLRYDRLSVCIILIFISIFIIDTLGRYMRESLPESSYKFKGVESFKKNIKMKKLFEIMLIFMVIFLFLNSISIGRERFLTGLKQGKDIVGGIFTPDFSYFKKALAALLESFYIAVFASLTASILSILLTYFNAYNIRRKKCASFFTKIFVNIIRTFPPIISAIIFFRGTGPGAVAGAFALSIYTLGVLTKMYSERIEALDDNIKNSLKSLGAGPFITYIKGILPATFPEFLGLSLYRFESNIRNSTILGIIGAGGIGTLLEMNIRWRNWHNTGMLLLLSSLMIILVDRMSLYVRRKLKSS